MPRQPQTPKLEVIDLGRRAYRPVLRLQKELVREVRSQPARAVLLTVEHDPPVITLGRRGVDGDVLASPEALSAAGVEVHQSRRGGQATWHGPGQLVAYLICRLDKRRLTLRGYVNRLEEAIIHTLGRFGIPGRRREEFPGVWAGGRKIAAVGVAVERWVTYHGLALNVDCDLANYESIVPCGLSASDVTSMERLGQPVSVEDVKPALAECICESFGFEPGVTRRLEQTRQESSSAT
ncbi:MAG: lipoyl(octanoyl) transferase LipB [Phycisphaerae bacterium]